MDIRPLALLYRCIKCSDWSSGQSLCKKPGDWLELTRMMSNWLLVSQSSSISFSERVERGNGAVCTVRMLAGARFYINICYSFTAYFPSSFCKLATGFK